MNTRRNALTLGAAVGGLMAAGFLQTAVAFAAPSDPTTDVFGFTTITGQPEAVTAISGIPPLYQQIEGTEAFNILTGSGTTAVTQGSITTDVSTFTANGFTNTEYLVTGGTPDVLTQAVLDPITGEVTTPAVLGVLPTDGSVYDVASFAGYMNEYTDIVGATGTNTITDTLVTPFGFDLDLSSLFQGFDSSVTGTNFFQDLLNGAFGPDLFGFLNPADVVTTMPL